MVLTQQDLKEVGRLIEEKITEKTSNLPTKEEFFTKMDEVMGELKDIREEIIVSSARQSDHEDRITSLEEPSLKTN